MLQLYRKQLKDIESFRLFVNKHFEEGIISDEDKIEVRKKINRMIPLIKQYANDANINIIASQNKGGRFLFEVDLIDNIFQKVIGSTTPILDLIDRIYGYYDNLRRTNLRKLKNPFFYIGELIRLPFHIFEFAGFNGNTAEASIGGKIWKVIGGFILYLAALATILVAILTVLTYLDIKIQDLLIK